MPYFDGFQNEIYPLSAKGEERVGSEAHRGELRERDSSAVTQKIIPL